MSEIEINPTLIMMYKKKSDQSITNNKTTDTVNSPSKKVKKKVSFTKNVVEIINVISYKKYYSDDITDEHIDRKESVKCQCVIFWFLYLYKKGF